VLSDDTQAEELTVECPSRFTFWKIGNSAADMQNKTFSIFTFIFVCVCDTERRNDEELK
jgi:hypothetical protein